jgi:hypothetical protein
VTMVSAAAKAGTSGAALAAGVGTAGGTGVVAAAMVVTGVAAAQTAGVAAAVVTGVATGRALRRGVHALPPGTGTGVVVVAAAALPSMGATHLPSSTHRPQATATSDPGCVVLSGVAMQVGIPGVGGGGGWQGIDCWVLSLR